MQLSFVVNVLTSKPGSNSGYDPMKGNVSRVTHHRAPPETKLMIFVRYKITKMFEEYMVIEVYRGILALVFVKQAPKALNASKVALIASCMLIFSSALSAVSYTQSV